nr:MAG TPA: hypothetical protein [Caudoviricetes sp.]
MVFVFVKLFDTFWSIFVFVKLFDTFAAKWLNYFSTTHEKNKNI